MPILKFDYFWLKLVYIQKIQKFVAIEKDFSHSD